jgi:WD40 repeat protein
VVGRRLWAAVLFWVAAGARASEMPGAAALPPHAVSRLGDLRFRHGGAASFVCYSADGKQVISAGADLRLRIWDAATGRQLREWKTSNPFYQFGTQRPPLDVSSDGRWLLMAESPESSDGSVFGANVLIRRSMRETRVALRNLETGEQIRRFAVDDGPLTGLSFVNGDRLVATATLGGPIQLWDRQTGRKGRSIGETHSPITDFAFSPDGKLVAWSGFPRPTATVTVYDVTTGKTQSLRIDGGLCLIMFVGNDKLLVSVQDSNNSGAAVSTAATGDVARKAAAAVGASAFAAMGGPPAAAMATAAVTLAGTAAEPVTAAQRVAVEVWDARAGNRLWRLTDHQSPVTAAALSHEGRKFATASTWDGIRLWDSSTGKELRRLTTGTQSIQAIAFSTDGSRLVTGTDRGLIQQWNAETGAEISPATVPGSPVQSVLFLDDGVKLVTAEQHGLVRMWRSADGVELRRLFPDDDTQADVGLALDGHCVLAYGLTRRWWDTGSGRLEFAVGTPPGALYSEVISSDHRAELRASEKSTVLWDRRCNKELCPMSVSSMMNTQMDFQSMALSPDARWLASRTMAFPNVAMIRGQLVPDNEQGSVVVYNTSNGQERRRLRAPGMMRTAMAFSSDDRLLAMAAGKEIRVYEMQTGTVRYRVPAAILDETVVRFSPKSRLLAWGGPDGSVGVINIWSPSSSWTSVGHRGGVQCLAFAGERYLASGGADATALVWDLSGMIADRAPAAEAPGMDLWRQLGDLDSGKAFEAQRRLLHRAHDPVAVLRRHVAPAAPADAALLARLIGGLDHDRYEIRERSRAELENLGDRAASAVMQALQKPASLEAAHLLHEIRSKLDSDSTTSDLAASRAIEVLEQLNTPDACRLLEELASGMPEARLTKEAKSALDRMRSSEGDG